MEISIEQLYRYGKLIKYLSELDEQSKLVFAANIVEYINGKSNQNIVQLMYNYISNKHYFNIELYKLFKPYFNKEMVETIEYIYKVDDKHIPEFNTSSEFVNVVSNLGLEYLIKHLDIFGELLIKNKKIIKQFEKRGIWRSFIVYDYLLFKQFCDKFKINHLSILLDYSNSGVFSVNPLNKHSIKSFLDDLEEINKPIEIQNIMRVILIYYNSIEIDTCYFFNFYRDKIMIELNCNDVCNLSKCLTNYTFHNRQWSYQCDYELVAKFLIGE